LACVAEYMLVTLHSAGVSRQYSISSKLAHLRSASIIPAVTIRVRHGLIKNLCSWGLVSINN